MLSYLLMTLAIAMPVFYLPITSEFFEFNKLTLLTGATVAMIIMWALKLLITKKVYSVRSTLNAPIMALIIVFILSSVFSINPVISLFGKYGRWAPSLFALAVLVAFYYATSINLTSKEAPKKIVNGFIIGISINSIVSLLSYFGLHIMGGTYAQSPNFTLTGSSVATAILAAIAVALAIRKVTNTQNILFKVLWVQVLLLNFIIVALYSITSGWLIFVLGILLATAFTKAEEIKANKAMLLGLVGSAIAITLVFNLPQTRNIIASDNFTKEIQLSLIDSWVVSSSTITDFPLLGSGPSTFGLNFTRYKPARLNTTNMWNTRFDKPANELFNSMGELGIIGTIAIIYLGIRVIKFALNSKTKDRETSAITSMLASGVILLLAVNLVTYATILTTFGLVLFLALLTAVYAQDNKTGDGNVEYVQMSFAALSNMSLIGSIADTSNPRKREVLQYLVIVPMLLFTAFISYYMYRNYLGEYYLRKSIAAATANDGNATYDYQRRAISVNPQRAEYRNTYAQTNLLLASNIARKENLSDNDKATVQTLISQAIRETRVATEAVSPLSAGSWEVRAGVYKSLIGVAENADQWALGAYNTAIQLDPTNPRLRLEAGGVYFLQKDYLSSANLFRQATNLKADYANAHYNLAQALKQLNNYALAQRELELTARLLNTESEDYKKVQEEIAEVAKLAAGQAQAVPSVEDLDQQAQIEQQGTVTQQEGLTEPDDVQTIQGTNAPILENNTTQEAPEDNTTN